MSEGKKLYLKHTASMEPLFNSWYAWPLLIAPHTAAMILNHHLRIMESFVQAPDLHRAAARNPAMRGGPFMNFEGSIEQVKELIASTRTRLAGLLALGDGIRKFEKKLQAEATGFSLEELYKQVPAELKGYVELGYDLNNKPSVRFIESLLYRSEFYKPELQTLMMKHVDGDARPFVLSTPRFGGKDESHLDIRFDSPLIDTLFRMRVHGGDAGVVEKIAASHIRDEAGRELFRSFFTEQAPTLPADRNYTGDGVRVRYLGHATVLMETQEVSILTDPIVCINPDGNPARYTIYDLPDEIDYVLFTHSHQDHVMFETMLQLRHRVKNWVVPRASGGSLQDPSLKLILQTLGFRNVIELDELQTIEVTDGAITGLPFFGEHGDLHIRSKLGFHVGLKGKTILCLADSNNLESELYRKVHAVLGDADYVFIGMECEGAPMSWLYGPLFSTPIDRKIDQSRRLNGSNCERGVAIVDIFNPREVYVYAMGAEPWLSYISSISYEPDSLPLVESNKLIARCQAKGLRAERLFGRKALLLEKEGSVEIMPARKVAAG